MSLDKSTLRHARLIVSKEYEHVQTSLSDAIQKVRFLEGREAVLKPVMKQLDECVCKSCMGHGELLVFYDQDDSKYVICKQCNGAGFYEP